MRYLVVRRQLTDGDMLPVGPMGHKRGDNDRPPPFKIEFGEFTESTANDERGDPTVIDVILSVPFKLIDPISDTTADTAWGIEAVGARSHTSGGKGVTVAVLDTGIDVKHPAFTGLTFGPENLQDFTADERGIPGSAPDDNGHGTHVAGTIFGREVAGKRIGVAPGVENVLIGKVLGPNGGSTEAILNSISWAFQNRADVISMSLGIDFPGLAARLKDVFPHEVATSRALEAYRSTVRLFDRFAGFIEAHSPGGRAALLVAASGNESQRERNRDFTVAAAPPAAAEGFISVGAVGPDGAVADFSNTGCLFSAPGVGVLSAWPGGTLKSLSGTSMATPHAAGVAAIWTQLLFPAGSRPRDWTRDVRRQMETTARPLPYPRNDVGLGLVQAPPKSMGGNAPSPPLRTRGG